MSTCLSRRLLKNFMICHRDSVLHFQSMDCVAWPHMQIRQMHACQSLIHPTINWNTNGLSWLHGKYLNWSHWFHVSNRLSLIKHSIGVFVVVSLRLAVIVHLSKKCGMHKRPATVPLSFTMLAVKIWVFIDFRNTNKMCSALVYWSARKAIISNTNNSNQLFIFPIQSQCQQTMTMA